MANPISKLYHKVRGRLARTVGTPMELLSNSLYDFRRFRAYSGMNHTQRSSLEAWMTKEYHRIEKGLSLPEPRPGFGKQMIIDLVNLLNDYLEKYGRDEVADVTLNTLEKYCEFNARHGVDKSKLKEEVNRLRETYPVIHGCEEVEGGTLEVKKTEIASLGLDFARFAASRHSIRNFAEGEVTDEQIIEAAKIAQSAPSVCNRQPWKLHVFSDPATKEKVLECQNGNRGFGHTASKVLLITSDLSAFLGIGERNQAYIEGGLFSMSLAHALHSMGLGTCCLNLSIQKEGDRRIRETIDFPPNETVIMMIAVGQLHDTFKVARSHRKPVDRLITFHDRS